MKKRSKLSSDFFIPFVNRILLVFALINFLFILYHQFVLPPKIIKDVKEIHIITNHVIVVTNYLKSAHGVYSSSTNSNDSVAFPKSLYYSYSFCNRPIMYYCNTYYYEGDLISYGRIDKIFPDRVLIDGEWVKNEFNYHPSPLKKEETYND